MGDEVLRFGAARSIQYLLRDRSRGLPDLPIYRVDPQGRLLQLGVLSPVCPEGYLMRQDDGVTLHSAGLPWWLFDVRPQGFLGRAFASRHAAALGLPAQVDRWSDAQVLQALLVHGQELVGNLVIGEDARLHFLQADEPRAVAQADKAQTYESLSALASRGEAPGSSAGGEQPKFVAYAETQEGPHHVLVKFSVAGDNPVIGRWRDLLLAEHLALVSLREAGVDAVQSQIIDTPTQRFLELVRFDRDGPLGRHGLFSLAALDAEFVGAGAANWPSVVQTLAKAGVVQSDASAGAALLHAFGDLIGNTDMHHGNLSFVSDRGRPYALAPAYDMLPMGFRPSAAGALLDQLAPVTLVPDVEPAVWLQALGLAGDYLHRLQVADQPGFSRQFQPCILALEQHLQQARTRIARLA